MKAIVVRALPHALAYSFVGIQTLALATLYSSIYWNCACLITNSGGNEDAEDEEEEIVPITEVEDDDDDDAEYEDLPDRSGKKKKTRNTNYGKISTAIGQMKSAGIIVAPPNINKSSYSFVPDVDTNTIIYGIKGITRIGSDLIEEIMTKRPFVSFDDFCARTKTTKTQIINLIKAGAFDNFEPREKLMARYLENISDKKQRLTLQNMQMLITKKLLPEELSFEVKVYNFNKYIKKFKNDILKTYGLDERAQKFYRENYDEDLLFYTEETVVSILQKDWDKIYKKEMDPVREYLKEHKDEMLEKLNSSLLAEITEKYAKGSISKWEMESIGFYYHEHELANVDEEEYGLCDFSALPEQPEIERLINIQGKTIPIYKLATLAGTVLNKDKNKSTVTILTTHGVVDIKIYRAQFAKYDKQVSERQADGKKKVIEKSWFTRGNKILVRGIRRDDTFQLKKYKNTPGEVIELITDVSDYGELSLRTERLGEE